jgi:hypothetical protein
MPRGFIRWEAPPPGLELQAGADALFAGDMGAPLPTSDQPLAPRDEAVPVSIWEECDLAYRVDFPCAGWPVALRANGAGLVVAIEEERAFNHDANRSDKGPVLSWRLAVKMLLEGIANLTDRILIGTFVRDTGDFSIEFSAFFQIAIIIKDEMKIIV